MDFEGFLDKYGTWIPITLIGIVVTGTIILKTRQKKQEELKQIKEEWGSP